MGTAENMTQATGAEDPWFAYTHAVVRLETPEGAVHISSAPPGQSCGEYPDHAGRTIYVITAHNPRGQLVSDGENRRAQKRLKRELQQQGWNYWPAAGGDPSWTHVEASAAVVGVGESEVIALGAKFGQDAIFVLTPASLRIVGCLESRELAAGWSIIPEAGAFERLQPE